MKTKKQYLISHLSDLHLTADDEASRTEPRLFGSLKGMNTRFRHLLKSPEVQKSSLIIVTGDVTDTGELDAWKVFWDAVRSNGLLSRVLVIPGNHDVCCLGVRLPSQHHAAADLQKAINGLRLGGQIYRYPWAKIVSRKLVIFGINSNNLGNLTASSNAMGKIGYFQQQEFARLLFKHKEIPLKIVAIHHSPNIPEKETALRRGKKPMSLIQRLTHEVPREQRRALRLLCVAHNVRLIVHGHLHEAESRRVAGVQIIGAPATTEPISSDDSTVKFWQYRVHPKSLRLSYQLRKVPCPSVAHDKIA
jgi:predicted phosphodiesterase